MIDENNTFQLNFSVVANFFLGQSIGMWEQFLGQSIGIDEHNVSVKICILASKLCSVKIFYLALKL